jgi:hypothetical protein
MANERMKDYQVEHDAWKKTLPGEATPELSPTAVPAGENLTKSGEPKKKPGPKPKTVETPKIVCIAY